MSNEIVISSFDDDNRTIVIMQAEEGKVYTYVYGLTNTISEDVDEHTKRLCNHKTYTLINREAVG
jgi:hypothetical protein